MIREHHLSVARTARYFTNGVSSAETTHIWFVLHGYGQLASGMLRWFSGLDPVKHRIVAPEGLHRFYTKGFSGKVGASWMTREDRLSDINDYIHYLNSVYDCIRSETEHEVKTVVLGFSQGAATATRWICNGHAKADHFVLWAGVFPPDVSFDLKKPVFDRMQTWLVCGDKDEFIDKKRLAEQEEALAVHHLRWETIPFEGTHKVAPEPLAILCEKIVQDKSK